MSTSAEQFLVDLGGGSFVHKLSLALSEVAKSVCEHEKGGAVAVNFKISAMGSAQVTVSHALVMTQPTKNGERKEKSETKTAMFVNEKGNMTFFQENQNQLFSKTGEVETR